MCEPDSILLSLSVCLTDEPGVDEDEEDACDDDEEALVTCT